MLINLIFSEEVQIFNYVVLVLGSSGFKKTFLILFIIDACYFIIIFIIFLSSAGVSFY
jgi:hypothetical protein